MGRVGEVRVPRARWGGRWFKRLAKLGCSEEWTELADYASTSSYQVARSLNIGAALPEPPAGKRFEFGSRLETDGGSTLLVRCVDVDG
jgi:hypothetical protein